MTARRRYGAVLGTPHVRRLLFAAIVARLPLGIDSLAIVLFVRDRSGSYAVAGVAAAASALGAGIGTPLFARLIDRMGQRRVLVPIAFFHGVAQVALITLGLSGAPDAALVAAAFCVGLGIPPLGTAMRSLWPDLLEPDLVPTAFALDSVLIELIFVVGPLLTAIATGVLSPAAALGLSAVLVIAGTLTFTSSEASRAWRVADPEAERHPLGALVSPGVRTLMLVLIPFGFAIGAMEVMLPAFCEETEGSRALAGVLLALWSLASAAGGLWYGARPPSGPLGTVVVRIAVVLPLGFLPALAASSVPTMALLILPAGIGIAPLLTAANQLIAEVAPRNAVTEAYAWPTTTMVVGLAAGSAVSGLIVESSGWEWSIAAITAASALAAIVAVARRSTLVPQTAQAV